MNQASKQPLIWHFSCEKCDTIYPILASVFEEGGCSFRCITCENLISLHHLSKNDGVFYLEYLACSYIHTHNFENNSDATIAPLIEVAGSITQNLGAWIENTVSKYKVDTLAPELLPDSDQNPYEQEDVFSDTIGEMFHKWTVFTHAGIELEYKTFADLRASLKNSDISKEDEIVNSDGSRVKLEDFAGTKDLFLGRTSNEKLLKASKLGSQASKKIPPFYLAVIGTLLSVCFIGAASYFGLQKYRSYKANTSIQTVINDHIGPKSIGELSSFIEKVKNQLAEVNVTSPMTLVKELGSAIKNYPNNNELKSLLSQALFEAGTIKKNKAYKTHASNIAHGIFTEEDQSHLRQNALARIYWKNNKLKKAQETLEYSSSADSLSRMLLANIYLDQNLFDEATLQCSSILSTQSDFKPALALIVRVFEQQNKLAQASSYQEQLTSLDKSAINVLKLVDLYRRSGNYEDIIIVLDQTTLTTKSDKLYSEYIIALSKLGRSRSVQLASKDFYKKFPKSNYKSKVKEALSTTTIKSGSEGSPSQSGTRRRRRRRR